MQNFKILKNEVKNVGSAQKQTILIKKNNDTIITNKQMKAIVEKMQEKFIREKHKRPKFAVYGLSTLGWRNIKGYEESINNMFEDEADYLSGRAKDDTKFTTFTQMQISFYA